MIFFQRSFLLLSLLTCCVSFSAQSQNTLKLSPQFISTEILTEKILPLLSPKAQLKYIPQENVLLVQDQPAILARVQVVFDLLNKPPMEVELRLHYLETERPIAPTPKNWEELTSILKENPPLFHSKINLNSISGEKLALKSMVEQSRSISYSFHPIIHFQGHYISLTSDLVLSFLNEEKSESLKFKSQLVFRSGEVRRLVSIPKEFHHSPSGKGHLTIFAQCNAVPQVYSLFSSELTFPQEPAKTKKIVAQPSSPSKVKLEGIIFTENNPKNSWVFLRINNITQQVKVGQRFQGVQVLDIKSNQATLEQNGRRFKLFLE